MEGSNSIAKLVCTLSSGARIHSANVVRRKKMLDCTGNLAKQPKLWSTIKPYQGFFKQAITFMAAAQRYSG